MIRLNQLEAQIMTYFRPTFYESEKQYFDELLKKVNEKREKLKKPPMLQPHFTRALLQVANKNIEDLIDI